MKKIPSIDLLIINKLLFDPDVVPRASPPSLQSQIGSQLSLLTSVESLALTGIWSACQHIPLRPCLQKREILRNIIQPLASERSDFGLWRASRNGWGKGAKAGRSLRDGPSHQQA